MNLAENPMQTAVADFHRATDQPVGLTPALRDAPLRSALIAEEVTEAAIALRAGEVRESAKELCDVLYVVFGSAVTFGLTLLPLIPPVEPAEQPTLQDAEHWARLIEAFGDRACQAIAGDDLELVEIGLGLLAGAVLATGIACGLRLEECFAIVHASNMTKIGGPVRPDGKRLKPATYRPADLSEILPV